MDKKNRRYPSSQTMILLDHQFRRYRVADALCRASIIKYRCSAKKFFSSTQKKNFDELTLNDFDEFVLCMKDQGVSNNRIANVISAMKRLLGDLQQNHLTTCSLSISEIRKPKIFQKEVAYLTNKEVNRLILAIQREIQQKIAIRHIRMMALVILLLQTGARIGEALSIDISDIDGKNLEVPIIGKGSKPRTLFLKSDTLKWINLYLKNRNNHHAALFTTLNGQSRWQQTDVGRSFRRYKKLSGIEKHFTLHTLRHTFATSLAFNNVPFNIIQALLGHSKLETTIKYYIGPVEKHQARSAVKEHHFDFIPAEKLPTTHVNHTDT